MKLTRILITAAIAAFTVAAQASPANWPPPAAAKKITTQKAADDCCDAGGKVLLACPGCKTLSQKDDKKGIAAWFKADSTHDCAGCKGKITVTQKPTGGNQQSAETVHVCSICTKDSPYTCAVHPNK